MLTFANARVQMRFVFSLVCCWTNENLMMVPDEKSGDLQTSLHIWRDMNGHTISGQLQVSTSIFCVNKIRGKVSQIRPIHTNLNTSSDIYVKHVGQSIQYVLRNFTAYVTIQHKDTPKSLHLIAIYPTVVGIFH